MVTHPRPATAPERTVLFYRDLRAFSGGHLKVFHYYTHVQNAPGHAARIAFSDETVWDGGNPWSDERPRAEAEWTTERGDVFFVAGMDWRVALARGVRESNKPVINLIQHVRHADPTQDVHPFLGERAIRICVSAEVETAIRETGRVAGPTFVIPNGIEPEPRPPADWRPAHGPRTPVLVVGTKNRAFAAQLAESLRAAGVDTVLHDHFVDRATFLDTLARFAVTAFCPDRTEGFYLPALEGMNRGTFVVCPDCVGNRGFCKDGATCLSPAWTTAAMTEAVLQALCLPDDDFDAIRRAAAATAARHSLAAERERFHSILFDMDRLWAGVPLRRGQP